jgi:two-component system, LytTR family, response regulator
MASTTEHPSLKILIAEDEPLAREGLVDWVRALPQLELVGAVGDGVQALAAIREQRPQLVLMDIQMPGLSGLQVLRALQADEARPMPAVIFTTAYDEHALAAFELHAVDYLLKPFEHARFAEAVGHVLAGRGTVEPPSVELLEAARVDCGAPLTRLLVRDGGRIVPLNVEQIEHLRSDTKYTAIVTRGKTYLVRLPIAHFAQRLDGQRFLKLSRSCIVNLDFVDAMTPDDNSQLVVQLRDGSRFTASREVSKELRGQSL